MYKIESIVHDYFSSQNLADYPERFTVIGFVAADGCIYDAKTGQKQLIFNISSKDKEALEIINNEIVLGCRNFWAKASFFCPNQNAETYQGTYFSFFLNTRMFLFGFTHLLTSRARFLHAPGMPLLFFQPICSAWSIGMPLSLLVMALKSALAKSQASRWIHLSQFFVLQA